jgi:single-stranded-DNA-specific exonuclease
MVPTLPPAYHAGSRMITRKRWTIPEPDPRAAELAAQLRVSAVTAQVLLNRGLGEPDAARAFLTPSLKQLHEPSLLAGLDAASERVARAVRGHEPIVIYGDYDVDGITATSILWHALRLLGADVRYYIPHRLEEGYGLNPEAVAELCAGGAKLIITVDCGVTALAPAAVAKGRGVDLIVTDHHEWKHDPAGQPVLPDCFAIVHPKLPGPDGQPYPNPNLCGAGVAFKLAWGIGRAVVGANRVGDAYRTFLVDATALAALGTIADVVPLTGENRAIAAKGLAGLERSRLTGILALVASAGLTGKPLDAYHVGFRLGPRLNAAGRMGHAKLAVEMLTDASPTRAAEIAAYLEGQNKDRQATERAILAEAIAQAEELGCDKEDCRGVVLGSAGWHPGVVGIVASRIVERFHRPAVLLGINGDGVAQGSGRSVSGFHLARALAACGDHLDSHGGHEMAAGLKLRADRLPAFRAAFTAHAADHLTADQLRPEVRLEVSAPLPLVTLALIDDLRRMAPFGQGNRQPLVCLRDLTIAGPPRRVGKTGATMQLQLSQGGRSVKGVIFNAPAELDALRAGQHVDVAADPQANEYNGYTNVELHLADVRPAGEGA